MNRLVLMLGLLSLFPLSGASQNLMHMTSDSAGESSVFVPIAKYLQRGDAECLAAWFADNLQVNVMGTVSNCSRSQARQIIRNFFTNYFTVTILVKTNDAGNYIEQLKIEKQ